MKVVLDKVSLKKDYDNGFITLTTKEWELLYNSLITYSNSKWNDETDQRIQNLQAKILMLYAKDNPKIVCSNKKLKKFKEDIFK